MADDTIEFMLTTEAVFPVPPDGYHYKLMKMEYAFAVEAALQAKGDYYGHIQRAIHPEKYLKPNPNPYHEKKTDPYHGIVGFRFEVLGTKDIREAYRETYDVIEKALGQAHCLQLNEVSVSRGGVNTRSDAHYHPIYNPD